MIECLKMVPDDGTKNLTSGKPTKIIKIELKPYL